MFIEKKHIFFIFFLISLIVLSVYLVIMFKHIDNFYDYTLNVFSNPISIFLITEYLLFMIATMLMILIEGKYFLKNKIPVMIFLCIFCTPVLPLFLFLYIKDINSN